MVNLLRNLVQQPVIGHVGTRDKEYLAYSAFFIGASMLEEPTRLVAYLFESGAVDTRRNLLLCDHVAITLADVMTYESIQVKGKAILRPITASEQARHEQMIRLLTSMHYGDKMLKFSGRPLVALELTVAEIYNQTPGPGAGERMLFE